MSVVILVPETLSFYDLVGSVPMPYLTPLAPFEFRTAEEDGNLIMQGLDCRQFEAPLPAPKVPEVFVQCWVEGIQSNIGSQLGMKFRDHKITIWDKLKGQHPHEILPNIKHGLLKNRTFLITG